MKPISLTVHDHLLYVLNAGAGGNITGFTMAHDGLAPIAGSTQPLGVGSSGPAQVSFSPNGKTLVVTEKASSSIDTYAVGAHGRAGAPAVHAAAGARRSASTSTSTATCCVRRRGLRVVVRRREGRPLSVISGAVATHQAAPCWLVTSKTAATPTPPTPAAGRSPASRSATTAA